MSTSSINYEDAQCDGVSFPMILIYVRISWTNLHGEFNQCLNEKSSVGVKMPIAVLWLGNLAL